MSTNTGKNLGWRGRGVRAFSLIEVLIATVILALGLIGVGAIFPVVITQQRDANDLSSAVSLGESVEALLSERLGRFEASLAALEKSNNLNEFERTRWYRVSAVESVDPDGEPYLQMPSTELPGNVDIGRDANGNELDLRLRKQERKRVFPVQTGNRNIDLDSACGPLDYTSTDAVQVTIDIYEKATRQIVTSCLIGIANPNDTKFVYLSGDNSLFNEAGNNGIYYGSSCLDQPKIGLNVAVPQPGVQVAVFTIDYEWLDDHIVADDDRYVPKESPRYGWEMAFRRGQDGQVQYCLFMYRMDGNGADHFHSVIADPGDNEKNTGMLRIGRGTVRMDTADAKNPVPVLDDISNELETNMDRGVWLLPLNGSGPVKVRRSRADGRWELDSVPSVLVNGKQKPAINEDLEWYYLPLQVVTVDEHEGNREVEWKITPLLAYTKQVTL